LKTATNVSSLLRGYQAPSTVTSTKTGPLTSAYYQGSPLNQVVGLGATLGAGLGTTRTVDPKTGVVTETPNWLSKLYDKAVSYLPNPTTPTSPYSPPIDQSGDEVLNGGYWDDNGNWVEKP